MGLEDFGVILRPTQPILVSELEDNLSRFGFTINAVPAVSFPYEIACVLTDEMKNIEILARQDRTDPALLDHMSIRYAICQPPLATEVFLDLVAQLVSAFCLRVTGIAPGAEFDCNTLTEFRDFAAKWVMRAKLRWSTIFAGDTEEVVLSVSDSWRYFIAKHPNTLQGGPLSSR